MCPQKTINLKQGIIYGPVHSRRLGLSLGINLMPTGFKLCSFNCIYCQYGWTEHQEVDAGKFRRDLPGVEEVLRSVSEALRAPIPFDFLTFSGNGESTLHPDFPEILQEIVRLRNTLRPQVKIALLSNGSGLQRPDVRKAVLLIDYPFFKLDAGDEGLFRLVNRPHRSIHCPDLLHWFSEIPTCRLQSLFFQGKIRNTDPEHLDLFYRQVKMIQPVEVQVYSLDRGTPFKEIYPLSRKQLAAIAWQGQEETGVNFRVFL